MSIEKAATLLELQPTGKMDADRFTVTMGPWIVKVLQFLLVEYIKQEKEKKEDCIMHWYVTVETDNGDYYCCVVAGEERIAERKAKRHYEDEGEEVFGATAEMWNDYEHGAYNDYEIIL